MASKRNWAADVRMLVFTPHRDRRQGLGDASSATGAETVRVSKAEVVLRWLIRLAARPMRRPASFLLLTGLFLGIASQSALSRVIYAEVDGFVAVEIERPALKVFIGNPAIADIVVISDRKFFVLGRQSGQTSLIALDENDETLLDARVIVEPLKRHRVTVHTGDSRVTYSCGERCVEIEEPGSGGRAGGTATQAADGAAEGATEGDGGLSGGPTGPDEDTEPGRGRNEGRGSTASW